MDEVEDTVYQITFDRHDITEQHIRDAKNADDWPGGELHEVTVDPSEITIAGTPEGIRWFHDYLEHLNRAWRDEGEQWEADVAEEMATRLWREVGDGLPGQQRTRRVL